MREERNENRLRLRVCVQCNCFIFLPHTTCHAYLSHVLMFHIKRIPSVRAAIPGNITNLNKKVHAIFFLHIFRIFLLFFWQIFIRHPYCSLSVSPPSRCLSVAVTVAAVSSFSPKWTIFAFLIFYLLDMLYASSFRLHSLFFPLLLLFVNRWTFWEKCE